MGFIKNTLDHSSHNETRNTIANEKFTLNEAEIVACNQWINDYCNVPYALLKNSIDEFSWGLEQIDVPTGFEQYTTALEMTLLPQNQPGKNRCWLIELVRCWEIRQPKSNRFIKRYRIFIDFVLNHYMRVMVLILQTRNYMNLKI